MSADLNAHRSHAALESMLVFGLRLTCRTGLHIGAGKSAELVGSDLPVMRDASGRPLIPGSSLRGVLRSGIEALSASLALDERWPGRRRPVKTKPGRGGRMRQRSLAEDWAEIPLVERLFGRVTQSREDVVGSYASRVQISDLPADEEVVVELRDAVAISRESRTAAGSAKFDLEVVPAGTVFSGRVRLKNPADYEVGLLAQALVMLHEGMLLVGGKTARGLGWMEVEVTPPRTFDAASLLEGGSGSGGGEGFGPVEEHLGVYLDALRNLIGELPAVAAVA